MNCDLICGKCRHRWYYSGAAPWEALAEHRATVHPEETFGTSPLETRDREPGEDDGPTAAATKATP